MIILGYAGYNLTLRQQNIKINRTCRQATAEEKGIEYLEDLTRRNLEDLYKTVVWTHENNIKFYRIGSDLCPHITNYRLFTNENDRKDFTKLLYSLEQFQKLFKKVGNYAKKNNIRLTFHPDIFNVLNSIDDDIVLRTFRDLHYHTTMLKLMELDTNSILVLHGGGIYGDKINSMKRWIENFNKLPNYIKERIVLENDETNFNTEDVLKMVNSVDSFEVNIPNKKNETKLCKPPVVFDIFHYYVYNLTILRRELNEVQLSVDKILPLVKKTWDESNRIMKIHISEQLQGTHIIGAHADFVNVIPDDIINFAKKIEPDNLYCMVECKTKELGVLHLKKKYPEITA